ncbi:3-dehydroquinate dehydratase II [hydrothermal vent metagenome]|uniref:3-dehydroquinate dehydratase n=1 Tax=hydrothermal vent metagenome TaxID=652676 RepID=A0A3B0VRV9_9ZZZZ
MNVLDITVLNGPNLNLLGLREPDIYGSDSLQDIEKLMNKTLKNILAEKNEIDISLTFFQSNREYELVDKIQALINKNNQYIIFNPAAFTHTSVAIRDALLATKVPFIEVHLSNIHAREEFRKTSWFSDIAMGTITGLGADGYQLALKHIVNNYT